MSNIIIIIAIITNTTLMILSLLPYHITIVISCYYLCYYCCYIMIITINVKKNCKKLNIFNYIICIFQKIINEKVSKGNKKKKQFDAIYHSSTFIEINL